MRCDEHNLASQRKPGAIRQSKTARMLKFAPRNEGKKI